jgi:hypothetical protein
VWYALTGTTYEIPTPYQTADLPNLQFVQSGDVVTITHQNYAPRELKRYSATKWILSQITFGPTIAAPTNLGATGGAAGATRYWAVTAIKETTLEESLAAIFSGANLVPAAATPTLLSWNLVAGAVSYNVYRSTDGTTYGLIESSGGTPVSQTDTTWGDNDETASTISASGFTPAPGQARNALTISVTTKAYDGNYTVKCRTTLVAGVGSISTTRGRVAIYYSRDGEARVLAGYFEVAPIVNVGTAGPTSQSFTINVPDNGYAALTIDCVPEVQASPGGGTCTMNVNMATGPDNQVAWSSGATQFSDAGDTPDYSLGPPAQAALFGAVSNYPAACMRYQQRQLFGNTAADPEKLWGSRTASDKSFTVSTPLQADDMFSLTLAGRQVNAIKHMLDLTRLIIFTSASVMLIDGDDAGVLRPDATHPRKIARHGIGRLPPLERSHRLCRAPLRRLHARRLGVRQEAAFDRVRRPERRHAPRPHVPPRARALGWHRHDTDGTFENVCVLPEGRRMRCTSS